MLLLESQLGTQYLFLFQITGDTKATKLNTGLKKKNLIGPPLLKFELCLKQTIRSVKKKRIDKMILESDFFTLIFEVRPLKMMPSSISQTQFPMSMLKAILSKS